MRFRSKPHVIHAFQFRPCDFKKVTPWQHDNLLPEWFIDIKLRGKASITISEKEQYVTLIGAGGEVRRVISGEWVCINTLGKIFILTDDEMKKDFEQDGE